MSFVRKIWPIISKYWAVCITVALFVILLLLWIIWPEMVVTFFGAEKSPSEILTYIGVACGAILLLGNQFALSKRNYVMEKGQLDIRFKDAATLLASDNSSAMLSGVYALHQVAADASNEPNQKSYVFIIFDLLCAFIRENSRVEISSNNEIIYPGKKNSKIIFQSIINVLIRSAHNEDLSDRLDLTYSNLSGLDFHATNLSNANLRDANLSRADLSNTNLIDADLSKANLNNANSQKADLSGAILLGANLSGANLSEANLSGVYLGGARLGGAWLCGAKLNGAYLSDALLLDEARKNIRPSINKETNFAGTIYSGWSKERLMEYFTFVED